MFFDIAYAAVPFTGQEVYDITDVIRVSVALVVFLSGALAVLFIIWGGVMLILSGGKDDKVKPAINSIRYAVVGVIVILLSIFILPNIGNLVGLNVSKYISPKAIFTTIQQISTRIFSGGGSSSDINLDSGNGGASGVGTDFTNL